MDPSHARNASIIAMAGSSRERGNQKSRMSLFSGSNEAAAVVSIARIERHSFIVGLCEQKGPSDHSLLLSQFAYFPS
jgi:hypothetical protein